MATTSLSLSSPDFFNVLKPKPKPYLLLITTHKSCLPFSSQTTSPLKRTIIFEYPIDRTRRKSIRHSRTYATSGDTLPLESPSVDDAQQIVSASGDDGVAPIISILLFVAFLGLTTLTFGVKPLNFQLKQTLLVIKVCYGVRLFDC